MREREREQEPDIEREGDGAIIIMLETIDRVVHLIGRIELNYI